MSRSLVALLLALLMLAGCSGDDPGRAADSRDRPEAGAGEDDDGGDDDGGGDVVPVDPVSPEVALDPAEEAFRATAAVLEPGQTASFSGELEATISSASITGTEVEVVAAFANAFGQPLLAPSLLVTCADGRADADLDPGALAGVLEPGARVEDVVTVGLPPDCDEPLVQVVAFTAGNPAQSVAYWSIEG